MKTCRLFAVVFLTIIFISGCGSKKYDFDKMSREEIASIYNSEPGFKFEFEDFWVLDSIETEEEAQSIFIEEFEDENSVIAKCEKVQENEKYFVFDVEWLYMEEQTYSQRCLLFRKDIYDTVTKTVAVKEIKEVFDILNYSHIADKDKTKMLQPSVKKEGDSYIYTVYIIHQWEDSLYVEEAKVTVDAQTGKIVDEVYRAVGENIEF